MPSSSKASLTEKDDSRLPYPNNETEYRSITAEKRPVNDDLNNDDHESFQEHEYASEHPPRQKPFYRRKRVLITCAIGTVIFLAIFIPLLILVIIPKIAQALLDSSSMQVKQLNMASPAEEQMSVAVTAQVGGIPKIFSAELSFTEDVQVFWKDGLIGTMTLSPVSVKGGKGDIQQETGFKIVNGQLFAAFAKEMLSSDNFEWKLVSKATLKALGQTIKDLKVDKVLKMNGLSNFSNLKILKFDLPSDVAEGARVAITASIANPSPIGMPLGTITLDMNFQSTYLGRVVAKNVKLVGGENMILSLEGTLLKQSSPVGLADLSLLMSNYLGGIPTPATAKGVSVLPDGVNAVSWLTGAIQATTMTVPLVSPEPLNVIQGLNIADMGLVIRPDAPWTPTASSDAVRADFKLPFNISINITELANATMTLIYKGTPLADLTAAVWNKTTSDMANNKIVFTLPSSPLPVKDDAHEAFQSFLTDVLQNTDTGFDVKGSVDSVATTPLGVVRLKVPFMSTVALKGIGFASISPTITNVTVIGGTTEYVLLAANVGINNPSIFSVDAGPVNLKISGTVEGTTDFMGDVILPNLRFSPGLTTIMAQVRFRPTNPTFRDAFFSHFVAGATFDCVITGDETSTDIVSLQAVTKVLSLKTKVPGIIPAPRLIVSGNGVPTLGSVLGNRQIPLTVSVMNPLQTTLEISDIQADVYWKANYFGGIQSQQAFSIAVGATVPSPQLTLQAPSGFQFGMFMATTFLVANPGVITGAIVPVDMTSSIGVSVGGPAGVGYKAKISYNQTAVPAFLKLDLSPAGWFSKRADEIEAPTIDSDIMQHSQWLKHELLAAYPKEAKKYLYELGA